MRTRLSCTWRCWPRTRPSLSPGRYGTRSGRWSGSAGSWNGQRRVPSRAATRPDRAATRCSDSSKGGRVQCQVIAPALVPRKPGERIKTDRRDARKLAELYRAGLLTVVQAPTPAEEAERDLCRARDDARADRQRCRHRLGKLLLRRGLHYPGRAWTQAHRRWVDGLNWPHPADQVVVEDYLLAIDHLGLFAGGGEILRLGEPDQRCRATAPRSAVTPAE